MFTIKTANEFLAHEVMVWGESEVDQFLNDGFVPAFVGNKWTWINSKDFALNPRKPVRQYNGLTAVAA